jgi:hypothetical protein
LAGPVARAGAGSSIAGGVDLDGDRRTDALVGLPGVRGRTGGAAVSLLPTPPARPATPALSGGLLASNVEAVIDDSRSMARYDPGGALRRQALELLLTNPANTGRVVGAVEFDRDAHQVLPPLAAADPALQGARLDVLRRLLRERISNNGGQTNVPLGFAAAEQQNAAAQARIFFTDGGDIGDLAAFERVRTYVVGLRLAAGATRTRLAGFADRSGGRFYSVANAGELQAALAAIDTLLRGETALNAHVQASPGVKPVKPAEPGEAAAAVSRPHATVAIRSTLPRAKARLVRRLRLTTTWDRRDTRFTIRALRLRLRGGRTLKIGKKKLRRALAGRPQRVAGGLRLRGHRGRTFLALDIRGLTRGRRGRRATAAVFGASTSAYLRRTRGSRKTVTRSRWTYQRRPG